MEASRTIGIVGLGLIGGSLAVDLPWTCAAAAMPPVSSGPTRIR